MLGSTLRRVLAFSLLAVPAAAPCWCQVGDVKLIHDPSIICEGDTYYVFSTGVGSGQMVRVHRSSDLYHWQAAGQVFSELPAWTKALRPRGNNIWAPDVSRVNGEYRLYYSVSSFGTNRSAIGLATSSTLDSASGSYRWIDRGMVIESSPGNDDWNAIDPQSLIDGSGAAWLAFGSYWSGIKLRRLDLDTGLASSADTSIYALASRPRSNAVEAPFIVESHGHYFLFVSFDACCKGADSDYKLFVGRSSSVVGPYRDRRGTLMTDGGGTLVLKGYGHIRGPGHCAVLQESDGDWLVHHYYDADEGGASKLQIRQLLWSEDDWPLAADPLSGAPSGSADASVAGTWMRSVNFEAGSEVRLFSNGRTNGLDADATWSLNCAYLTLRWPNAAAPGGAWIEHCVLSADGFSYAGWNQDDAIIRGTRVRSRFIRGDTNGDAAVDLSDAVHALTYLFEGSGAILCTDALDANDDGKVDLSDPIFILSFLFGGGARISFPRATGGVDPTADGLGC